MTNDHLDIVAVFYIIFRKLTFTHWVTTAAKNIRGRRDKMLFILI